MNRLKNLLLISALTLAGGSGCSKPTHKKIFDYVLQIIENPEKVEKEEMERAKKVESNIEEKLQSAYHDVENDFYMNPSYDREKYSANKDIIKQLYDFDYIIVAKSNFLEVEEYISPIYKNDLAYVFSFAIYNKQIFSTTIVKRFLNPKVLFEWVVQPKEIDKIYYYYYADRFTPPSEYDKNLYKYIKL
jgi:hypothetical protein